MSDQTQPAKLTFGEIEHEGDVDLTMRQLEEVEGVSDIRFSHHTGIDSGVFLMEVPARFNSVREVKDWLREENPELILGGF